MGTTKMPFAYIASPYSANDLLTQRKRYIEAVNFTHWVAFNVGLTPFSPVVHWHEIAQMHNLPTDAATYMRLNNDMLDEAKYLYVLAIYGWDQSLGVAVEMERAARRHISISLARPVVDPPDEAHRYHISPLKYKGA